MGIITGSAESVPKTTHYLLIMQALILALLPLVAFADHAPAYGYGPQYHCRDTNTSVYAEVCVPAFTTVDKPITLDVKVVEDNDYCYQQITTVCSLTTKTSSHTLCTYSYQNKVTTLDARVTQVTYAEKSETMKVTSCKPSGYGDHYGAGEHQYCREEYQTQAYKVPLVTADKEQELALTEPQPEEICTDVDVEITEVVCTDDVSEKCVDLVKFGDSTNTVDQVTTVISEEPNCNAVTLSLDTKACRTKPY